MPVVIPLAHDFICPWCWIGWKQARQLESEYDVQWDWQGYELFPDELEWPEPGPAASPPAQPDRPPVPSRMDLAYAAAGMTPPTAPRPPRMRSHYAHEAVEYAKLHGVADELLDRLYPALWEGGLEINSLDVLVRLATGLVPDLADFRAALLTRRFAHAIVGFDEPAYATGIYNVPTFRMGEERLAEAALPALRDALDRAGVPRRHVVYPRLKFPAPPPERPTVVINMVTTIDGKIVTGNRDEPVMDLGSPLDHQTLRAIEVAADAVLLGAGSLRATPKLWYPSHLRRYVVTRTGVPTEGRFFTDAPNLATILGPDSLPAQPDGLNVWRLGASEVDLPEALRRMRQEHGVRILVVEGGSELNAHLLRAGLVDELFLTLAPKLKLGAEIPTYAGGLAFRREEVQTWSLVSEQRIDGEVFLRYRRPGLA